MNQEKLDLLYKEVIMEHNKDPRNYGSIDQPDLIREGFNPLCGDKICLHLKLDGAKSKIQECRYTGEGCSICMASASIMSEEIEGQSIPNIESAVEDFRQLMKGKKAPEDFDGDVEALAGVRNFPVRIKCALLPWTALNDALKNRNEKGGDSGEHGNRNHGNQNAASTTE